MLEIEPFSLSLTSPLETAAGTIEHREGFLVFVEYEGTQGVGEATPLPGWTESRAECREALSRAATVAEELDWGIALARMEEPAARHALALALAEARARAAEEPLYRSLDTAGLVTSVPVNATIGEMPLEETVEAADVAVSEGFYSLKCKVGSREVEEDVERLRAVREQVGDSIELRADANGAWTLEEAERAFDALVEVGVSYVEQPLPAENLSGHTHLRGGPVDVALDESLVECSLDEILSEFAADVVVLKPMVVGGPDRARESAMKAREVGVDPVISTTVDAVVGRTGAVHVAASIPDVRPCGLATASMLAEDLSSDPAVVTDGAIEVPQDKGLGLPERPRQ